jgi:hypothetical protein
MQTFSSAQRRKESLKAIEIFTQYLFTKNKKLSKLISVDIKFRKLEDAWGICDYDDDCRNKPREFTILINRNLIEEKDVIMTVAHEMVHVWQYATGKFKDYAGPAHRYEDHIYDANMRYRDMPWEIEARRLERVLYKVWKNNKYNKME